ncbi:MAG: hypothetical protein R2734_19010 [Nocardioides sp.]
MTYRLRRLDCGMSISQPLLEQTLNGVEGDVVAIVPNVMQAPSPGSATCSSSSGPGSRRPGPGDRGVL